MKLFCVTNFDCKYATTLVYHRNEKKMVAYWLLLNPTELFLVTKF